MPVEKSDTDDLRRPTRTYFKCDVPRCKKRVTASWFCHGCQRYVCEKCDINHVIGPHEFKDHYRKSTIDKSTIDKGVK